MNRPFSFLPFALIFVVVGCGGNTSSSSQALGFPAAGSMTFHGVATVSAKAAVTVSDPTTGATVSISAGAMKTGSKVDLTVWSGQHPWIPSLSNAKASTQAVDVSLDPSKLAANGQIIVRLPWANASSQIRGILAFNSKGGFFPLLSSTDSTPTLPSAIISKSELSALIPTSGTATITLVVEEVTASSAAIQPSSRFRQLMGGVPPPTNYASKKRIGIVVHGLFGETGFGPGLYSSVTYANSGSYMMPVLGLLSAAPGFPTDGSPTKKSAPFDAIYAFEYDTKLGIDTNGNQLAGQIQANFGNSDKFEVHIVAHSMGGLVSRWAFEQNACPSVVQLITLGTPHQGVPYNIIDSLGFSLAIGGYFRGKGLTDLADNSSVVKTLSKSKAAGVSYYDVAGTSFAQFHEIIPLFSLHLPPFYLGDVVNSYYTTWNGGVPVIHDGIVLKSSASGGPALAIQTEAYNHTELVDRVNSYWGKSLGSWLFGINRRVKKLEIFPVNLVAAVGSTVALTATPFDKDGDRLDPALINAKFTNGLPVTWSVDKKNLATIDPASGVLTGVAEGKVKVTATTASNVLTTTDKPVTQSVTVTVAISRNHYVYRAVDDANGNWAIRRTDWTGNNAATLYAQSSIHSFASGICAKPDGSQIAVWDDNGHNPQVVVLSSNGNVVNTFSTPANDTGYGMTGDANYLYRAVDDVNGNWSIKRTDWSGKNAVTLYPQSSTHSFAFGIWAKSDGSGIAVWDDNGHNPQVVVLNSAGAVITKFSVLAGETAYGMTGDANYLYRAVTDANGNWSIQRTDWSGKNAVTLYPQSSLHSFAGGLCAKSDGSSIAVWDGNGDSPQVVVLSNSGSVITQFSAPAGDTVYAVVGN